MAMEEQTLDDYFEIVRGIGEPCTLKEVKVVAKRSYSQTAKVLKKLCERGDLGRMYKNNNCKIIYYFSKRK